MDLLNVDDTLPKHLYVFELESWLYIFVHVLLGCVGFIPGRHPLRNLYDRNWDIISEKKDQLFRDGLNGYQLYLKLVSNFSQIVLTDVN